MRTLRRLLLLLIFFLSTTPGIAQIPTSLQASLQSVLDSRLASFGSKGGALTVFLPDGSSWTTQSGVSNSSNTPVDPAKPILSASFTKLLTSIVILQLYQEGKLDLDDPISTYLPALNNVDGSLTIRELLRQTTTIGNFMPSIWSIAQTYPDSVFSPWFPVQNLIPAPVNPGKSYNYSDSNHQLLGLIIETITGNSGESEFKGRIFDPLGLTTAALAPTNKPGGETIGRWVYLTNSFLDVGGISVNSILTMAKFNAGVMATTREMITINRALHEGMYLADSTRRMMLSPSPQSGYFYGFGTMVQVLDGDTVYGHGGGMLNSSRTFYNPTRKIGFCVAKNDNSFGDPDALKLEIYRTLRTYVTDVEDHSGDVPSVFQVSNYPNPFNPSTTVSFGIPARSHVRIDVFNALGQSVAVLADGMQDAGIHRVTFDAKDLPSGVYLSRMQASSGEPERGVRTAYGRMVLLR